MPMSIVYLKDGGIVATGRGIVTGGEIGEVNDAIYESVEKTKKIAYQICDFTNVSKISISNDEIKKIADQDSAASEINPDMLVAIVCEEDFGYGLSRMWEGLTRKQPFETMVFRKMEDAQKWIKAMLPADF